MGPQCPCPGHGLIMGYYPLLRHQFASPTAEPPPSAWMPPVKLSQVLYLISCWHMLLSSALQLAQEKPWTCHLCHFGFFFFLCCCRVGTVILSQTLPPWGETRSLKKYFLSIEEYFILELYPARFLFKCESIIQICSDIVFVTQTSTLRTVLFETFKYQERIIQNILPM